MNNQKQPIAYAEDVNYWQTSQTTADTWIERAKDEIGALGGKILEEAVASREGTAFMLAFKLGVDEFKAVWPVLPSKTGRDRAARIQAATMLYHDVKAKCVSAKVLGTRAAFLTYLVLADGRTAAQVGGNEIAQLVPPILALPSPTE